VGAAQSWLRCAERVSQQNSSAPGLPVVMDDGFLHQQGLDTSTPSGRAMFQMLGVFAEFERSMIRERVMAGLSRAKADGVQLGRRRLEDTDAGKVAAIIAARLSGVGVRRIARDFGVGVGTVLRLTDGTSAA
jgi:DNA invertase Pin-like site-specific DNA recombinase